MTVLEVIDLPADRLPGEMLVVPLFEDQRPLAGPAAVVDWRLDGALTRMMLAGEVCGRPGEVLALPTNAKFAAPWVMLVGGGRWQALNRRGYVALAGRLLQLAVRAGIRELAMCLPPGADVDGFALEQIVGEVLTPAGGPALCRLSLLSHCV